MNNNWVFSKHGKLGAIVIRLALLQLVSITHAQALLYKQHLSYFCSWQCLKCEVRYDTECVSYRYRLHITVVDGTTDGEVAVFGSNLQPFFGVSASQFSRYGSITIGFRK